MKKLFLICFLSLLSLLLVTACNSLSPYSQMAQPITTNTNVIYESDGATLSNAIETPTTTGSVSSNSLDTTDGQ